MAALSFHETKNIISGEGGALLANAPGLAERAEIIREKGTNRAQFFRGQVDKYTWHDLGSSYLPSELIAAFLWAQMEEADAITRRRLEVWGRYHEAFAGIEREGLVRRPVVPAECDHNAHMYYLILPSLEARTGFMARLRERGVDTVFHYVPLHSSTAGKRFGRATGSFAATDSYSERLVRLPLWIEMTPEMIQAVIDAVVAEARVSQKKQLKTA
jgi:dTDP-4-amino-4,6-dideoxygalactose transaminase